MQMKKATKRMSKAIRDNLKARANRGEINAIRELAGTYDPDWRSKKPSNY